MKTHLKTLTQVSVILAVILFAGCIGQEEEVGRTQLIIAMPLEMEILDIQQAYWSDIPSDLISQPLVAFDLDLGKLVPDLAEKWEVSPDGKVVTWYLPEDAKYSNDDPFNAEALKDTWIRYKTISPYKEDLEPMIEFNVIDDSTLKVIHSDPPAFTWAVLATSYGAPWDAAEANRVGDEEFGRNPIGTGPFKLKEWVEGSHMLFERNENYQTNLPFVTNKGPPHLEEVLVRFIPEDLTRLSELEAGSVDIIADVPSSEVARLQEHPDIQLYDFPTAGTTHLMYNTKRPPYDDINVRRALASAMNRADLAKTLSETVDEQYAFLAPAQICYSEEMQQYAKNLHPYNVEQAKTYLADAGWTDTDGDGIVDKDGQPFTAELLVPTDDPPRTKIGVVVQAQLQAIGLDITISTYEGSIMGDIMREGDFDLGIGRVSWSDPDILIYLVTDAGSNVPKYQNPIVDEKIQQARYIMDLEERTAVYAEVQKILIDDVVYIPLFSRKNYTGVRTWVKDLVFHKLWAGQLYLNDVTIKEEE